MKAKKNLSTQTFTKYIGLTSRVFANGPADRD